MHGAEWSTSFARILYFLRLGAAAPPAPPPPPPPLYAYVCYICHTLAVSKKIGIFFIVTVF